MVREGDFVVCFGGDEFVMFLNFVDEIWVVDVVEILCVVFKMFLVLNGVLVCFGVSVGGVFIILECVEVEDVLFWVDIVFYCVK